MCNLVNILNGSNCLYLLLKLFSFRRHSLKDFNLSAPVSLDLIFLNNSSRFSVPSSSLFMPLVFPSLFHMKPSHYSRHLSFTICSALCLSSAAKLSPSTLSIYWEHKRMRWSWFTGRSNETLGSLLDWVLLLFKDGSVTEESVFSADLIWYDEV